MTKVEKIILLLGCALLITSCSQAGNKRSASAEMIVSVSVLPQKYFVESIGGDHVQVNVMVGPGDSPHSYEPKASQMTALSNSRVYFKIGVEFEEAWMPRIKAANSDMQIVDVSQNISRLEMASHEHTDSDDHEEEAHAIDPHIWTSPQNGIQIANTITDSLISLDAEHADEYRSNRDALIANILSLQDDIKEEFSGLENRSILVFHPAWGYFAHEFELQQIPIEVEGSEPSPRELTEVIEKAKDLNIHVIFAQPEFSTRTAENIATEINGKVLLISPLAENWLENLRQVATIFSEEL